MTRYPRIALALASIAGLAALTGCGLGTAAGPASYSMNAISGKVMGGHTPVYQATITLYAASASSNGYGATTAISDGTATTDANGNFTVNPNSGFTCTAGTQLYVVGSGGNPGSGTNTAAVLVSPLGECSNVTSPLMINEVTTIAAAYALAPFADMSSNTSVGIGSSSTNKTGIVNAFLNAANLVDYHTGIVRTTTPGGNGTVPTALINTLGNALAACVNSTGASSTGCANVLVAPPTGTTTATPATTWQLALNWAKYPGNNVANVYANPTPNTTFYSPTVGTGSSAPTDLSVGVAYTAGTQYNTTTTSGFPWDIKADGAGNVWISGQTKAGLQELSSNGTLLSTTAGGYGNSTLQQATIRGLSIDAASPYNVWVADTAGNAWAYTPSTATTTQVALPSSITVNGNATPVAIGAVGMAVDGANNVWYGTYASTATATQTLGEIPAGTFTAKTSYTGNTGSPLYPATTKGTYFLAADAKTNNIWSSNQTNGNVYYFLSANSYNSAVGSTTPTPTTAGNGVAFDASGNTWVVNAGSGANGGKLLQLSSSGAVSNTISGPSGATVGLYGPRGIAIDGAGRLFVTSFTGTAAIVEYDPSLASTGSLAGYLVNASGNGFNPTATSTAASGIIVASTPRNITIDQAGATWVSNGGGAGVPAAVQVLGIAAPTNPVLAAGQYGVKP